MKKAEPSGEKMADLMAGLKGILGALKREEPMVWRKAVLMDDGKERLVGEWKVFL